MYLQDELQEDRWVAVECLRKGDMVKTYMHGYRPIEVIGKAYGKNIPEDQFRNMYQRKMVAEGFDEPLRITGWHSVLVDDIGSYKNKVREIFGKVVQIDEKKLLMAALSDEFEPLPMDTEFTYYHFVLTPKNDVKQRFGVWANGVLCETPNKAMYEEHPFIPLE